MIKLDVECSDQAREHCLGNNNALSGSEKGFSFANHNETITCNGSNLEITFDIFDVGSFL